MSIKQGYAFEDEFRRSMEKLIENGHVSAMDLWFYKMVDTHSFSTLKAIAGFSELTIPKVPADWLIIYQGRPMFVECKMSSNPVSYNTDYIKPHQIEHGLRLMAQGVPYYFAINQRAHDDEIKPGQKQNYEMYIISARNLYTLMMVLQAKERKSIKWSELGAVCDHFIDGDGRDTKTATWDISWLLDDGFDATDGVRLEGEVSRLMEATKKPKKKRPLAGFA